MANNHVMLKSFSRVLIAATALYICSCSSKGKTTHSVARTNKYYISAKGSDSNDGSEERPFRSITAVNGIKLSPGDSIFFEGGTTFNGLLVLSVAGDPQHPVVITSFNKGQAIIDGGDSSAVIITGSHFVFGEIDIKGKGRKQGNTANGLVVTNARGGVIKNITAEGFQKSGIHIFDSEDVTVKKVKAVNNGFSGIYVSGTAKSSSRNIRILDCIANDNPGDPTVLRNHSGNGILVGNADSVLIDHCVASNNGFDMPWNGNGPVGIWAFESNRVLIQHCISHHNKTTAGAQDGGGFDFDGGVTNSLIQYCLSYENAGAGYGIFQYTGATAWSGNTVRYSLSVNDGRSTKGTGGFLIWNQTEDSTQFKDCYVYNNVIINDKVPAVNFAEQSTNGNFVFANNVFVGPKIILGGPVSGDRFLANIWWSNAGDSLNFRSYKSFEEWVEQTGQEKRDGRLIGANSDPGLAGSLNIRLTDPYQLMSLANFKLRPGSALRNKGLSFPAGQELPQKDFFGNKVPQGSAPEPGIHELTE